MVKCQNKDKETNKYCEGKAKGKIRINGIRVCETCFYQIKLKTKEKRDENTRQK